MKTNTDWRLQPLRSFWQSVNWENRPLAIVSENNGNGQSSLNNQLSLLMPVREYFRAISWTGIPEIAVTKTESKAIQTPPLDENKETLEDFLNDISSFF
ncbi:MAG: hypothetical protein NW214_16450 [Pseudanabaenaceae cyanobacterium bins.39]|nr:hypothetical protein [Pseudanabaenaceae cyanobacterium bins.39]